MQRAHLQIIRRTLHFRTGILFIRALLFLQPWWLSLRMGLPFSGEVMVRSWHVRTAAYPRNTQGTLTALINEDMTLGREGFTAQVTNLYSEVRTEEECCVYYQLFNNTGIMYKSSRNRLKSSESICNKIGWSIRLL